MTVDKVLLFPNPKRNLTDNEIKPIEDMLASVGISCRRYNGCDDFDYDAIIALGGDGTMLNAARLAFRKNKPVLCINFGTLGYMSGLENSELSMLSALKSGFETEHRMLIDIKVVRDGVTVATSTALNEAVVSRQADGEIAGIGLLCDGATVCNYRADGVIFATPTGSSAYAMSAGGPIIDTKLDAFCVCPICPHALGARAMIFSADSVLEANNQSSDGSNILLSDGRKIISLLRGDKVTVSKSERTIELIKLKKDAFYETLYNKMS